MSQLATPLAFPHPPLERTCPVDLRPLPPVPRATDEEIRRAVAKAREAQDGWRDRDLEHRAAALARAAKGMLARRDQIIALVRDEVGKLEVEALFDEGLGALDVLQQWVRVLERALKRKVVRLNPIAFPGKRAAVDLVPRGVVGVIAPWNFPVAGLFRSVYPALLCGNGVVVKPSEYSPLSTRWFVDALAAELPPGLIATVQGDGGQGAVLIESGIDACVFTGSAGGGRAVALQCAERGIPSSIEMGGKDCAIVLEDCDRERTVAGLTHWALTNAGQACGAIEVALVEEHVADEIVARLASAWKRLVVGPAPYADISPLANRRQLEIVTEHVADALEKGARLVCGGAPTGSGYFFPPTILDHCTEEMKVVRDETFGPVLAIVRVDGAADGVRRVNRSRYGLGASIWTRDVARGEKLAERLEVGVVSINNHCFTGAVAALPWSGTRETGFGVANGEHALATFVRPRTLVVDESSLPEVFWLPWDRDIRDFGNLLVDAQLFKLKGAWRLPLLAQQRIRRIRAFFRR